MRLVHPGLAVLETWQDRGLSLWVERDGSLDAYDSRIRRLLAPLLPVGGCAIDGGAFLGSHTTVYAEAVGPTGRVVAFEPMPTHAECLEHNTQRYPQVEVVRCALYSDERTLWLAPNNYNAGATVVGSPDDQDALEVIAMPLDAFEWDRVDLIKLDIEGLVMRALEGADRVLRIYRPIVIAEVGDNLQLFGDFTDDVIAFMADRDYVAEEFPLMAGDDSAEHQSDILFRPKERAGCRQI